MPLARAAPSAPDVGIDHLAAIGGEDALQDFVPVGQSGHNVVAFQRTLVGEVQVFLPGQHLLQLFQVYHDGKTAEELLVLVVDGLLQETVVVGKDGVGHGRYGMA